LLLLRENAGDRLQFHDSLSLAQSEELTGRPFEKKSMALKTAPPDTLGEENLIKEVGVCPHESF
jgi:hypothetical protein